MVFQADIVPVQMMFVRPVQPEKALLPMPVT